MDCVLYDIVNEVIAGIDIADIEWSSARGVFPCA